MKRVVLLLAVLLAVCLGSTGWAEPATPWWGQGKIRFFWNPWMSFHGFGPTNGVGDLDPLTDEQLIDAVLGVGGTVFADRFEWSAPTYYGDTPATRLNRAKLAKAAGLHYFGQLQVSYMPELFEKSGARLAVNKEGKTTKEDARAGGRFWPCPLDEKAVAIWPFKYAEEMARSGVVDGLLIDWEGSLPGFGFEFDDGICYCDDCWANFSAKVTEARHIAKADRYQWLKSHRLIHGFSRHQQDRLVQLYQGKAHRIWAIKPDFIFSAYEAFMPGHLETGWYIEGVAKGLNSAKAPFFVIDPGHYYPNHTCPWWDTGYDSFRKLGMKHLLGYYPSGFMGVPTMDASASQQLYDAAVNTDGYWIWHERKWGPDDYTVMRAANERVKAVETKVGDFLSRGRIDYTFVTAVEQSGNPQFGRNIVSRTYHLNDRHLVHISNANTDNAVCVLVRAPRLKANSRWTARNAMTGVLYSTQTAPGGRGYSAVWTNQSLRRGVLLNLEKRSDVWLLMSPASASAKVDAANTVPAWVTNGHPDRPSTASSLPPGKPAEGASPLAFTRSGPLGYSGAHEPVMGTSVWLTDAANPNAESKLIFAMKGNCWSPKLSPDRTRVAFSSWVNRKGQIYAVNSDATVKTGLPGAEQAYDPYYNTKGEHWRFDGLLSFVFKNDGINLSRNGACDHSPVWSPDGSRIAFVSDRGGDWDIYVMNADGRGQRRLTHSPGVDRSPAWSPDGKYIAFETNRGGEFDIGIVGSDGTAERLLVTRSGDDLEPVWSPDGAHIAYTGNHIGYNRDVMQVDPVTGEERYPRGLLATIGGWWPYKNVTDIALSPDGSQIAGAFETGEESGVFVARARSTASAGTASVTIGDDFVYSADHKSGDFIELVKVPALRTRPGGRIMSPLRHLVTGGWYMGGDASDRWVMRSFMDVSWSTDGKSVIYRSDMDPSGYDYFYTVPAAGGDPVKLDDTQSPMGLANNPTLLNPTVAAPEADVPLPEGTKLLANTSQYWMFRTDPDKIGEAQNWSSAAPNVPDWFAISTHDFWDKALGTKERPNYVGDGWYVTDVVIPPAQGKRLWLQMGAVDENYTLWINGERISDNLGAGTTLWDQPVLVEITGKVNEGRSNRIVIRATSTAFAGGVWKPVRILTEK